MTLKQPVAGLVMVSMVSAHMGPIGSQQPEHKMLPGAAVGALLTASSTASTSPITTFVNATTGAAAEAPRNSFWSTQRGITTDRG
jgi:hypothetical protein